MRHVQIVEGLRIRFPGRSVDFAEGVEIGAAAALMAVSGRTFSQRVSAASLDQIRPLAAKLGYRLVVEGSEDGCCNVSFRLGPERPRLMLAHSGPSAVPVATSSEAATVRQPGARNRAGLRCV